MKYEAEYVNLIEEGLYEDLFLTLDKNINLVENKVEQRKQVREFISILNEHFDNILESGRMGIFANEFVHAFRDLPILEDSGKKLNTLFDSERLSLLFSFLVLSSDLNNAKFLLPFISKNLEGYPNTVNNIISAKNSESLRFLCENMENTHYGQGEILRKSYDLPFTTIVSLVEDFEFDINETNQNATTSLMAELVSNKNTRNFKAFVDRYADKINWGQNYSLQGGITIFDIIENVSVSLNFLGAVLDQKSLKSNYVERIGEALFRKEEVIKAAANTDIYDKLFSHPNFDHGVFNLGEGYCLYGLLSRMGILGTNSAKADVSKAYLKIVDSFLNSRDDDEMPQASTLHIVGAAIYVAKESPSKENIDACNLIVRRYRHYINKPNPDGKLPITQVEEDSALYRMLINSGAIAPNPPPGFWTSLAQSVGLMKKQDVHAQIMAQEEENRRQREVVEAANKAKSSYGSFGTLKSQMRDDFREMRQLLSSDLCDHVVRLRCENMFLSATDLVNKMEKYQLDDKTEDVYFLGQNFSVYLNKSLKSYMKVCEATVDFSSDSDMDRKLLSAKRECLEAIDLLDKQLVLITNNVSNLVESSAKTGAKVNKRFLENRLEGSSETLRELEANLEALNKTSQDSSVQESRPRNQARVELPVEDTVKPVKRVVSVLDDEDDQPPTPPAPMKTRIRM